MKKTLIPVLLILSMMQVSAQSKKIQTAPSKGGSNPFLQEWSTPYQTPPFSKIKVEHYIPAFEQCIKEAQQEIDAIKNNREHPTFANTIVALDRAGSKLNRLCGVFFNLLECDATPEMQKIATEVQPMLTEYSNNIHLDDQLFKRVKGVYEREYSKLSGADQMLLKKTYDGFIDNGADLNDMQKDHFRKLSLELANLTLQYGQNALAATNDWNMVVKTREELKGLPESEIAIAAQRAEEKGVEGYLFDLSFPSKRAILTYADNESLRKDMYLNSCNIAYHGKYDNEKVIYEILRCRQEIAKLLGYSNYAEYALHNKMAKDVKTVQNFLDELAKYSIPAAQKEMESLQKFAVSQGHAGPLQRWDFSYYSEKQKDKLYNLSSETLKPYFKLENVTDGIFKLANTLYGISFDEAKNIDTYHKDIKAYKVMRGKEFIAILYLDFHPRATKRSGAWMTSFREQWVDENNQNVRPLVSLVMNFTPSTKNNPSLLTFDELTTFLHEFGHALNGMLSQVPYQSISGTNSQHDFVELPSQLNENWATEYEFLKTFAKHYKTGELIPMKYIDQLKEMRKYLAGYASARQLSFGFLDMMWHTIDVAVINDVRQKEHEIFARFDVMPEIQESCMSTSFSHIFAGGYAAGYYGYKWAEMLEADAFSLFKEEGVMNKKVAEKYMKTILSQGGSKPAMEMFKEFRGRGPKVDALLIRDGLK
ncbi:MAG: M3 family metallopeptidase [Bacteroidales bacterium]|nr:M3 family metallopeptidase [Bacteroidales bacterium]